MSTYYVCLLGGGSRYEVGRKEKCDMIRPVLISNVEFS